MLHIFNENTKVIINCGKNVNGYFIDGQGKYGQRNDAVYPIYSNFWTEKRRRRSVALTRALRRVWRFKETRIAHAARA